MLCQDDDGETERLIMDQAYEAVGLRDNGDVYAIQVLGQPNPSPPIWRRGWPTDGK